MERFQAVSEPLDIPAIDDPIANGVVFAATVAVALGATIAGSLLAKELLRRKDDEKERCR
jgi:hypothetical protein